MKAAAAVATALAALTAALTWPVASHMASDLSSDHAETLRAVWAIGWVSRTLTHAISRPSTLSDLWNGNIFFPETGTLAFSEPYIGQALLALPAYWLTRNPILSYNIAFTAAFVLTGLGTFLLTRALVRTDGEPVRNRAAVLAAAAAATLAAFNHSRLGPQLPFLHLLSIQWLPFALLGFDRYLVTDRRSALAGGALALAALCLSSVYYTVYGAPAVAAFILVDSVRHGRARNVRMWLELWAAVAAVALAISPVVTTYLQRLGDVAHLVADSPMQAWLGLVFFSVLLLAAVVIGRLPALGTTRAAAVVAVILAVYLWQVRSTPLVDGVPVSTGLAPPAGYLTPAATLPAIYQEVEALSSDLVLLELPFGDTQYELRYMFFAAMHGRRLANGHSSVLPPRYLARRQVLEKPLLDPERATQALGGVTHVIVHRGAWRDGTGPRVTAWLDALGGQQLATAGDAVLYQIQPSERLARAHP